MNRNSDLNLDAEWEFYYPKVYGYFLRRLENRMDVEDLTSISLNSFFKTLSNPEKSSRIADKMAYLWKIAHNQLVNFIDQKSKKPLPIGFDDNLDSIDKSFENFASQNYKHRINNLLECIQKNLKDLDFEVVKLSIIEDYKSDQVGKVLNLSAANVRKKLSRSINKLREVCGAVWLN